MRVVHLCKMDAGGGAADGFMRIHEALLHQGVESAAYVMRRRRCVRGVIDASALLGVVGKGAWLTRRLAAKMGRIGRSVDGVFDFDDEGVFPVEPIISHAKSISARWDAVLVHWPGGFVSPKSVIRIADALGARIGLWQVDMAHMTGGCHYSLSCDGYKNGCGRCPALSSSRADDVTRRQAEARAAEWNRAGALVLAQSRWSAQRAAESFVLRGLRHEVMPIPLDLSVFPATPDSRSARANLCLPADASRIALVRTVDPRVSYKGFGILQEALRRLDRAGVRLHVIGAGPRGLFPDGLSSVSVTDLGFLAGDEAMSTAYQAADVFVCPSLDDAGPMMISEAMASGRPVLSTPVGLAPDLIRDGVNGALRGPPGDPDALMDGLKHYAELPEPELRRQGQEAAAVRTALSRERFAERLIEAFRE